MRDAKDVLPVYRAHHYMQALASIVKGFPDAPSNSAAEPPKRLVVFKQIAEAMLLSLEQLKQFKVIRDAVSDLWRSEGRALIRFVDEVRLYKDHIRRRSLCRSIHTEPHCPIILNRH